MSRSRRKNLSKKIRAGGPLKVTITAQRCLACGWNGLAYPDRKEACPTCSKNEEDLGILSSELDEYPRIFLHHPDRTVYERFTPRGQKKGTSRRVKDHRIVAVVQQIVHEEMEKKLREQERAARAVMAHGMKTAQEVREEEEEVADAA